MLIGSFTVSETKWINEKSLQVIFYLRSCLLHDAGTDLPPEVREPLPLENKAPMVSRYLQQTLSNPTLQAPRGKGNSSGMERNPALSYMALIGQLLNGAGTPDVMYCLLELVAMAPNKLAGHYINKLDWIKVRAKLSLPLYVFVYVYFFPRC